MSQAGPIVLLVPCAPMTTTSTEYTPEAVSYETSPVSEWTPAHVSESKAFTIKNPKTGEVVAGRNPSEKPDQSSAGMSSKQRAEWEAAAQAIMKEFRLKRWFADHSTFSALNVDGLRRNSRRSGGVSSLLVDKTRLGPMRHCAPLDREERVASAEKQHAATGKDTKPLRAEALLNRLSEGDRIPAAAAATLAALSLEPGSGRQPEARAPCAARPAARGAGAVASPGAVGAASGGAAKGSATDVAVGDVPEGDGEPELAKGASTPGDERWKSGSTSSHDDAAAAQEEPPTSAGGSQPSSLPESSADGAGSSSEEGVEQSKLSEEQDGSSSADAISAGSVTEELGAPVEASDDPQDARGYLLGLRALAAGMPPPPELEDLVAVELPSQGLPAALSNSVRKESSSHALPAASSHSVRKESLSKSLLKPTEKAYRVSSSGSLPRAEELKRTVQSLLNKVCPESVATIAEKIAEVKVLNAEELQHIIGLIFKKALSEPHYCETYADLVFSLKSAFPEFPCPEGGKPLTFKAVLLNICQDEFEALPTSLNPTEEELARYDAEELEFRRKSRKGRLLANMKLIGHLFLRQLVSARVISSVIQELTLCDDAARLPEEHVIECAVELLMSIGHTLESMPAGKQAIVSVAGRLLDLKQRKGQDGRGIYSKRVQFAIQDLLDARSAGWARKVFSGVAKTKEEIRLEQEREMVAQAHGREVGTGQVVISGQRPLYLSAARDESTKTPSSAGR